MEDGTGPDEAAGAADESLIVTEETKDDDAPPLTEKMVGMDALVTTTGLKGGD